MGMRLFILLMFLYNFFFYTVFSNQISPVNRNELSYNFTSYLSDLYLPPKVIISILIRNKAHSLPYLLGNIERLNYPKKRIGLFIRLDHCEDHSAEIINQWLDNTSEKYHSINSVIDENKKDYENEQYVTQWTEKRYEHIMNLKQEALDYAKKSWADYLFMIDADVMTIDDNILQHLMETPVPIIAPMLKCTDLGPYSNFWGAMTKEGYYKRSDDYFDIQKQNKTGTFPVPMVHSIYLINLNIESNHNLTFKRLNDSNIPFDDIIVFARSAEKSNSQMFIDNRYNYGYFTSPVENNHLEREIEMFEHLKFQSMIDREDPNQIFPLISSKYIPEVLPKKSKLGFDEIYMINLVRRKDRLRRMLYILDHLGIDAKYFEAIDGKKLTMDYIDAMGIKQLPEYADPYHKRNIKFGEIGCFLSHYFIWEEMILKNYEMILVLEDDIRFGPGFHRGLEIVLSDAEKYRPDWELLYIGRKRMSSNERFVAPQSSIVYPDYTYWTLGYILRRNGVKKLLNQKPLSKMVAVDEFLPIMFDRHPESSWKEHFGPRDLVAISSEPLLLEPTHYVGEPNYISDTEDSEIV